MLSCGVRDEVLGLRVSQGAQRACAVHPITRLAVLLASSGMCGRLLAYCSSSCMRSAWLPALPKSAMIS